ncbi:hypothetical protein JXB12_11260 [candidate division KSB1 bacterium]|nr:hypothetical protein [candidate division KSB1 bacterium]
MQGATPTPPGIPHCGTKAVRTVKSDRVNTQPDFQLRMPKLDIYPFGVATFLPAFILLAIRFTHPSIYSIIGTVRAFSISPFMASG